MNTVDEVLVCTLHARRWIFALRIRDTGDRIRPYNTQLTLTKWVTRLAKRNGLVPGHDIKAHLESSIKWIDIPVFKHTHELRGVGLLAREQTIMSNEVDYYRKEPVVARRLIVAFDGVYVDDLPLDFQQQVWRSQSMIQIGRDLKFPIIDRARLTSAVYSEPTSPDWFKKRDESYYPEKLRW